LSSLLDLDEKVVREEMDDYELTCQTIVATSHIITHDFGGTARVGRSMGTSEHNAISPNQNITPDLKIEVPETNQSPPYRAINEIKSNLPANKDYWLKVGEQLKKYDDTLSNWEQPGPDLHDIIFTTNGYRTYDFNKYLIELNDSGKLVFERKVSIVARSRETGRETFIALKKEYGEISNSALDERLSKKAGVNAEHILPEIYRLKFFDSEPPVIYTMEIIWDLIIKLFVPQDQFRKLRGNSKLVIEVTLDQLYKALCVYAPDSANPCIKKEWIRRAMRGFVELKAARIIPPHEEKFEVYMSVHRGREQRNWILGRIKELKEKRDAEGGSLLDFLS
jgi:hypothetical protein